MTAIALTIAGSDPSGGAGIQADLKTFAAHKVYGASVLTALTAQNTVGVFGIHGIPGEFVRAQAKAVLEDLDVRAIKVGMLGDVEIIDAVVEILGGHPTIPVVLDPVMVAASGDPLLPTEAVSALREKLFPLALIATPNVYEAALLLGQDVATSPRELHAQAVALLALGPQAILLKGGRLADSNEATDVFHTAHETQTLTTERVAIERPQGTGCTLSSAIAAQLALGSSLLEAVQQAKAYVATALERAAGTKIGHGARPLIH